MDAGLVTGPSEPEEAACEGDTPDYHRGKTPFWDRDVVVRREFFVVRGLCEDDVYTSQKLTKNHAEIW